MTNPNYTAAAPTSNDWKRHVTLFIAGQQATAFGSMMVQIAVLWYLTRAAESGWVLTLAIVSAMAPQAIVSLFSGVLADRLPRKLLIVGSDLIIALASAAMAVALIVGAEGLWFIFLASAIRSAFAGLQGPAFLAVLPQIAPEEELMRLNGIGESISSALGILAPLVGGVLMATVGLQAILAIDVVTAVVGIALLIRVPMRAGSSNEQTQDETEGFLTTLRGGFTYLRGNRPVLWLIVLGFGSGFFATIPLAMTILLVVRRFGGDQWMLSGLEMSFSAGYLVGAAAIVAIAAKLTRNRVRLLLVSMLAAAAITAALGVAPSVWLVLVAMFTISIAMAFWMTPYYTFLQEQVDEASAGRVFGIQLALDSASAPIAFLIFGPLADRFAVETIMLVVGGAAIAWIAGILAVPAARRALSTFDVAPAE